MTSVDGLIAENVSKEKSSHNHHSQSSHQQHQPESNAQTGGLNKKKNQNAQKWRPESRKQNYSHSWLVTSFKGHSATIADMDFSPNGKFLASSGEDDGSSGTSSGSEGNKENNPVLPTSAGLTRRQKKNRIRRDDGLIANTVKKKSGNHNHKSKSSNGLLKKHYLLGVPDFLLMQFLQPYLVNCVEHLFLLGFPVELKFSPGRAYIYKHSGESVLSSVSIAEIFAKAFPFLSFMTSSSIPLSSPLSITSSRGSDIDTTVPLSTKKGFDINAREFVPKENMNYNNIYFNNNNNNNDNYNNNNNNSNNNNNYYYSYNNNNNLYDNVGTISSYSPYIDVQYDLQKKSNDIVDSIDSLKVDQTKKRKCMRCGRTFYMSNKCVYLTRDQCLYHWGKLQKSVQRPEVSTYSCCHGKKESKGCTTAKLHVWSGLEEDSLNGPFDGYVRTRPRKTPPPDGSNGFYALDCEMCFTVCGLELTKVSVIGADGRIVYDTLVKPENEIIDYNTRFSGISAKDMNKKGSYKVLKDVQNDLMGFIKADTILIGHGVENDLRALKMIHTAIIDTSIVFPHYLGLPYRRSLKSLVECFLNKSIQSDSMGHDSVEDASSCLELMLLRVKNDMAKCNDGLFSTYVNRL